MPSFPIFQQFADFEGSSIANLHSSMLVDPHQENGLSDPKSSSPAVVDSTQLVRAARQLLSSVTRFVGPIFCDRSLFPTDQGSAFGRSSVGETHFEGRGQGQSPQLDMTNMGLNH